MNGKVITFGNTILEGSGKKGILKPMEPGGEYYLMNAGGFNMQNRSGVSYRFNDYLKECMGPNSDLNRRVSEGQVECELGHPPQYYWQLIEGRVVRTPITDIFEWIHRLQTIDQQNVCGRIRKIHWIFTGGDNDPVKNQIEVRPFGVHKQVLADALSDPDCNAAFSVRTVTKPQKFGDRVREVEYFTGYDLVVEPGMLDACKHRTAGLEDYMSSAAFLTPTEMETTLDEVIYLYEKVSRNGHMMGRMAGTESHERIGEMLVQLKKTHRVNQPIKMIRTNSVDVFC